MRSRTFNQTGMTQLEMVANAMKATKETETRKLRSYIFNTYGVRLSNVQVNRAKSFSKMQQQSQFNMGGTKTMRTSSTQTYNRNSGITVQDVQNIKDLMNRMGETQFRQLVEVMGK